MFAKTELNLEVHSVEMVTEHNALNTASAYVVCRNCCANVKSQGIKDRFIEFVCMHCLYFSFSRTKDVLVTESLKMHNCNRVTATFSFLLKVHCR